MARQLSGMDAAFVYGDRPGAPLVMGGILLFDPSTAPGGAVSYGDLLANIAGRLHLARAFRRKLVRVPFDLDHPYWVEDGNFDLEYHVRQIALPRPGDRRQLFSQAARIHARPLDLTRPLWELYMIEGLDAVEGLPAGAFALLFRMHHAAIDGVSGMELLGAIHDLEPDGEPDRPTDQWHSEPAPAPLKLLAAAGAHAIARPVQTARWMTKLVPAFLHRQTVSAGLDLPVLRAPYTRFNGQVSAHRTLGGTRVDLATVKRIKDAVPGSTVNDVILAWVGGGLRHLLVALGELPEASLVAATPISLRATGETGPEGNLIWGSLAPLGSDIADPLNRLRAVHAFTDQSKLRTMATGARALVGVSELLPGALLGLAMRINGQLANGSRLPLGCNTIISNVPGPQIPLYSSGARLLDMYGLGPLGDGIGLLHVVDSYCGGVVCSFTADREMLPQPELYEDALQRSFADFRGAVPAPKRRSTPTGVSKTRPSSVAKRDDSTGAEAMVAGKGHRAGRR